MQTKIEADRAGWERVAKAVTDRRTALGMTQEELASAALVSPTTIRYIETASRPAYRALTLARVAQALDWPSTRFVEVLAGGDADDEAETDLGDDLRDERINDLEKRVDELAAMVRAIYDRLIGDGTPARSAPRRRRSSE